MAYKLRLDPVEVLRDPDELNYLIRLAAAEVVGAAEADEAEKAKIKK